MPFIDFMVKTRFFFCFFPELAVERPHKRHAIGADEIELRHGIAELGVASSEGGDVGVRGLDGIGAIAQGGFFKNLCNGSGVIGDGDGETDDGKRAHGRSRSLRAAVDWFSVDWFSVDWFSVDWFSVGWFSVLGSAWPD